MGSSSISSSSQFLSPSTSPSDSERPIGTATFAPSPFPPLALPPIRGENRTSTTVPPSSSSKQIITTHITCINRSQTKNNPYILQIIGSYADRNSGMLFVNRAWRKASLAGHMDARLLPFLVQLRNQLLPIQNADQAKTVSLEEVQKLNRKLLPALPRMYDLLLDRPWRAKELAALETRQFFRMLRQWITKEHNPYFKCHLTCHVLLGVIEVSVEARKVMVELHRMTSKALPLACFASVAFSVAPPLASLCSPVSCWFSACFSALGALCSCTAAGFFIEAKCDKGMRQDKEPDSLLEIDTLYRLLMVAAPYLEKSRMRAIHPFIEKKPKEPSGHGLITLYTFPFAPSLQALIEVDSGLALPVTRALPPTTPMLQRD